MSTLNQRAWHFVVLRWYSMSTFIPYFVLRQVHSLFQNEFSRMECGASSFNLQHPALSLRSSCSLLHLLLRLPFTYMLPSTTCFTRQFLSKMRPIQIAFRLFSVCRVFLSSITVRNTCSLFTRSVQMICFILHQHHISDFPTVSDLLSEVSQFHRHTKSDSKRSM
jgi:hypothetical protein